MISARRVAVLVFFLVLVCQSAWAFSTSDLAGTWNGYAMELNYGPTAVVEYASAVLSASGGLVSGSTTTTAGVTVNLAPGTLTVDSLGKLSGSITNANGVSFVVIDGAMNAGHDMVAAVTRNTGGGYSRLVLVKSGGAFAQADLAGSWHGGFIETSSSTFTPYNLLTFSGTGAFTTGTINYPNSGQLAYTAAPLALSAAGKLTGTTTAGGVVTTVKDGAMNQGKEALVGVATTSTSFADWIVAIREGAGLSTSDLGGTWYFYAVDTNYTTLIEPAYGALVVGSNGAVTSGTYIYPDVGTGTIDSGSCAVSSVGAVTGSWHLASGVTFTLLDGHLDQSGTMMAITYGSNGTPAMHGQILAFKATSLVSGAGGGSGSSSGWKAGTGGCVAMPEGGAVDVVLVGLALFGLVVCVRRRA